MRALYKKLIIMVILYAFCNYLIWFDASPIFNANGKVHSSFFLGVPENSLWLYPACVILPILLFQPHIFILHRTKPLEEKKDKRIFRGCSLGLAVITMAVWAFVILG